MAIKLSRPTTPSQRFTSHSSTKILSKKRPEKALTEPKPRTGGRNAYGRITSRRRGGGHKKLYRIIDFKRLDKLKSLDGALIEDEEREQAKAES